MTTVAVRMYNVGFGDAFLVTVTRGRKAWRMLVDCGVHAQGRARPIADVVDAIIADLAAVAPAGAPPHLDVVVATHHHADHITGFALDAWQAVAVDEVWVPFVEDEQDEDAKALRRSQTEVANRLLGMVEHRMGPGGAGRETLADARMFAMNSLGNADATDRLLGRNGRHFATTPKVRYLPDHDPAANVIATTIDGVVAHVLGPPRTADELKIMDPPKSAQWLRLDADDGSDDDAPAALFNATYVRQDATTLPAEMVKAKNSMRLNDLNDDEALLGAAAVLENAVNNTSVFFVLDVAGTKLLFPGDAQQGAWDHVLNDPAKLALVSDVAFYKIGHHGSHNATPRRYVEEVLHDGAQAMLPWGLVRRWAATIPKHELIDALKAHHHHVTWASAPEAVPGAVTVHDTLWSEVTIGAKPARGARPVRRRTATASRR